MFWLLNPRAVQERFRVATRIQYYEVKGRLFQECIQAFSISIWIQF